MPPPKKQKTRQDSRASAQDRDGHSSGSAPKTNKSNNVQGKDNHSPSASKSKKDTEQPGPYAYICFHRPLFDFEGENWLTWSTNPDAHLEKKELYDNVYMRNFDKEDEQGIAGSSPEKHPGHKWVMMYGAWSKQEFLTRKAQYCEPQLFDMYLCNDWRSWGMTEILENTMIEFNNAYHWKGPNRLEDMWVIISAVGYWLNVSDHFGSLTMSEDGKSVNQLLGVMGSAVLTTLANIERAGELKPDSRFLDLALVIGYYVEFSHDLPAYGFNGQGIRWRKHVVEYFKKANLDPAKATATTKHRMEKMEKGDDGDDEDDENETTEGADKENISSESVTGKRKRGSTDVGDAANKEGDIWKWNKLFKEYKKGHDPRMGGNKYDITKMSRAERKKASFAGKDPLADVPAKDLREDKLDFDFV